MGTTPEYEWAAVALSIGATALAALYAYRTAGAYRRWHDERAAFTLVKGIGLLVISGGLTLSAAGLIIDGPALAVAGMSIARGTLVVLLATLVLAGARPGGAG